MFRPALLTLLALIGFATAQSYESVDPTGQTVQFWHQHGGVRLAMLDELVADFNATNPWGITVVSSYQGSYDDIFNKMLVLQGTNDVPDLVVAYQDQAATYAIVGGALDLWPFVRSERWGLSEEDLADIFPGFLRSDVNPALGGALLGFPPHRSMEVMFYNADWLAELGVNEPPATPEAFADLACRAAAQPFSRAVGGGRSLGYEITLDASRFASWAFAFGGVMYDETAAAYVLDEEAAQAAMTLLQDLAERGCIDIVTERFGDQTNFGTGRTLFTIASSSGFPFYRQAVEAGAGFAWSVAPLPRTTPEPVMNVYGASVTMPATASLERQVATWLFIRYYVSPEAQARWARASNYFPVRASVAAGLDDYFAIDAAYETAFGLLPFGVSEPTAPGYAQVRASIARELAAILDGADVTRTLRALSQEANEILADQLADLP
jgi:multiple sugar transport system substrate-binding protein